MSSRGRHALVGNALYHTVGDREAAIRQLAVDFDQAYADIGQAIGILPDEGSAARVAAHGPKGALWLTWWQAVERPMQSEWASWKAKQLSGDTTGPGGAWIAYANRWGTGWDEIAAWRKRLVDFRDGARRLGIHLASPEPAKLPTTTLEDIANKVDDKAGEVWKLGKILVIGGIAVGGAIALTSLVSNLRSGSDPVVSWRRK